MSSVCDLYNPTERNDQRITSSESNDPEGQPGSRRRREGIVVMVWYSWLRQCPVPRTGVWSKSRRLGRNPRWHLHESFVRTPDPRLWTLVSVSPSKGVHIGLSNHHMFMCEIKLHKILFSKDCVVLVSKCLLITNPTSISFVLQKFFCDF